MRTEIRLKQLLDEAGEDKHGRIERIAKATGLHRHTIRKFLQNEATTFSLNTISLICDYLVQIDLGDGLPGKLFGARPSKLLEAMLAPERVTFYLGESKGQQSKFGFARAWVARDDFGVAARLVERLSRSTERHSVDAGRGLGFAYRHIPSRRADPSKLEPDRKNAKRAFNRMRNDRRFETSVLIGSQRANYLVEYFVSDLFRSEEFSSKNSRVPFHLKYHQPTGVASCFGGDQPPPGAGTDDQPGIYFRHHNDKKWNFFPTVSRKRGAGIVVVRRDPGLRGMEIAVFGLTGIATAAVGKLVCDTPDRFWPEPRVQAGLEVGVYACGFKLQRMEKDDQDIDEIRIGSPEIVELDVRIRGKRPSNSNDASDK